MAVLIRPNLAPLAIVPLVRSRRNASRSRHLSPLPALCLALAAMALVRIAASIRLRHRRGAVRAREHRSQRIALLARGWSRPRRSLLLAVFGIRSIESAIAWRKALFAFAVLVIGVVSRLRRLRRLVVPALPAAGDGGRSRCLRRSNCAWIDRWPVAVRRALILLRRAYLA